MIEHQKLYRVYAVQREDGDGDNPTSIISAHRLASASTDTLSPIYAAIGADFSHQESIKKNGNILLEEISANYYFQAFWILCNPKEKVSFISASGVGNIETYVNMFIGWGLGFTVVLDDDSHGRIVFNSIKKNCFHDSDPLSENFLTKIKSCNGIEDLFSKKSFSAYVHPIETEEGIPISEHLKKAKIAKGILGYHFLLKVQNQELKLSDLDEDTQASIKNIVSTISKKIKKQADTIL